MIIGIRKTLEDINNQVGSLGININTRIEINTTVNKNDVPQRGCAGEKLIILSYFNKNIR